MAVRTVNQTLVPFCFPQSLPHQFGTPAPATFGTPPKKCLSFLLQLQKKKHSIRSVYISKLDFKQGAEDDRYIGNGSWLLCLGGIWGFGSRFS